MEKKKVLVIENSTYVTGALKSIYRTAFDLKDQFSFSFVIPMNSKASLWLRKNGIYSVREVRMLELRKNIFTILIYFPRLIANTIKLKRILRKENFVLIHNNDLYNLIPVVYKMFLGKIPYVCHIRFLPNRFPTPLFNFWLHLHLHFSEKIIVVSQHLLNQMPASPKVIFIPNELPLTEKYEPVEDSKTSVFLYISNYILGKGQDHALEAFAKVHLDIPEWSLRFVGSDMGLEKNKNFRQQLQKRAQEIGIAHKIEWLGFTDDVEYEYKRAEVVLNFSESESFSVTCLEAQFFGRPLIATDSGGPGEIITHKKDGWLVPNKRIDLMAEAMRQLAADKALRKEMGSCARLSSREKYSIEKTSLLLKSVYLEVLKNPA